MTNTPRRTLRKRLKAKTRWFLRCLGGLLCWAVAMNCCFAQSGIPAAPPQGKQASAPAPPIEDTLDCPFLPSCPEGPSPPLPPFRLQSQDQRAPAPKVDEHGVAEGRGKFGGMVLIPEGRFTMGSGNGEGRPDERPAHGVVLSDFYVGKQEVTAKEFCDFLNTQGETARDGTQRILLDSPDCPIVKKAGKNFQPKPGYADKPVVMVSWQGAADYASWAGGRLPTEAEWEKAALVTTADPPGDFLTILARDGSVPVRIAYPGTRGVSGMIGNVWEWCADWYAPDYYQQSPGKGPLGPDLGQEKTIRGGSWESAEASKRIHNRHRAVARGYFRTVGFRIVKDP